MTTEWVPNPLMSHVSHNVRMAALDESISFSANEAMASDSKNRDLVDADSVVSLCLSFAVDERK